MPGSRLEGLDLLRADYSPEDFADLLADVWGYETDPVIRARLEVLGDEIAHGRGAPDEIDQDAAVRLTPKQLRAAYPTDLLTREGFSFRAGHRLVFWPDWYEVPEAVTA